MSLRGKKRSSVVKKVEKSKDQDSKNENTLTIKQCPPTQDSYKMMPMGARIIVTKEKKIPAGSSRVWHFSKVVEGQYENFMKRRTQRPIAENEEMIRQKLEIGEQEEERDDVEWEVYIPENEEDTETEEKGKKIMQKEKEAKEIKKMSFKNIKEAAKQVVTLQAYIKRWLAQKEMDKLRKKAEKRKKVCLEILETEAEYIKRLKITEEVWGRPIKQMSQKKGSLVTPGDYQQIFGTGFNSLKNVNQTFYDSLEKCLFDGNGEYQANAKISKQILSIAPFFRMYRSYCVNYDNATKVWVKLKKNPVLLGELIKMEHDNRTTKMGLTSYLILPIQRIPRYKLLIRDLLKQTDTEHCDYANLNKALEQIADIADFLNGSIQEMACAEELRKIQEILIIPSNINFQIVSPHRALVLEGDFKQGISSKGKGESHMIHLFLFNDVIVFASKTSRGNQYVYIKHMNLSTVECLETTNPDYLLNFKLDNGSFSYIFEAKDIKEKKKWLTRITKEVQTMKTKRKFSDIKQSDVSCTPQGVAMETKMNFTPEECVEYIKKNKILILNYTGAMNKQSMKEFQVSRNEKTLFWYSSSSGRKEGAFILKNVQELVVGQQTQLFKRNSRKDVEGLSFSLLYGTGHRKQSGWTGKTLDLICCSKEEFLIMTRGLGFILKDQGRTTVNRNKNMMKIKNYNQLFSKKKFSAVGNDAYSWGKAEAGGLGHGDLIDQRIPQVLKHFLFLDVKSFECGESSGFITLSNGNLFTWGSGKFGKLGLGDEGDYHTPTLVKHLEGHTITQVSCGEAHSLILSDKGRLWGTGKNEHGQIGIGKNAEKVLVPTKIKFEKNKKIKLVCAGTNHSFAVAEDGSLYTWGAGKEGQLGHGDKKSYNSPKHLVAMTENIKQIALGFCHSMLLTKDGNIWVFGDGQDGQLGNGKSGKGVCAPTPERLNSAFLRNKVKQIGSGAFHSAAVTGRGKIFMWGNSMYGQVGNGKKETSVKYPTLLTQWVQYPCVSLVCGTFHTLAMLEDKDNKIIIAWGAGTYGRLGINKESDSLEPKQIKFFEGKKIRSIHAGGCMSAAICDHQWVPDKEKKKCMDCHKAFTFKRRKHHCRKCGMLVCSDCSKNKLTLIGEGFLEPVKVCNHCHQIQTFKNKL